MVMNMKTVAVVCGVFAAMVSVCAFNVVGSGSAQNELDESIRKIRMGTLVIDTAPGAEVRVQQLRHEFWFGAALANHIFTGRAESAEAAKYRQVFLENFNAAVTENALKWHDMEKTRGTVDYSVVDAMLEWTAKHDIPLRGHNVFWGIPNRVQPWLKEMGDAMCA
jgi:GH35 family endo-1,4-beta-xylanase